MTTKSQDFLNIISLSSNQYEAMFMLKTIGSSLEVTKCKAKINKSMHKIENPNTKQSNLFFMTSFTFCQWTNRCDFQYLLDHFPTKTVHYLDQALKVSCNGT